jgi:electron transport complex protein RnfG
MKILLDMPSNRTQIQLSPGILECWRVFTPEGKISSIAVLEHKETPGLGTKMLESPFKDQFPGKKSGRYEYEGNKRWRRN